MERTVIAHLDGAHRVTVAVGDQRLAIGHSDDAHSDTSGNDDPAGAMGRMLPTEALLSGVASCFALAMEYVAAKRGLDVGDLTVTVRSTADGPRLDTIDIDVASDADHELIERLLPRAERVCWVTNTLRTAPRITIRQVRDADGSGR